MSSRNAPLQTISRTGPIQNARNIQQNCERAHQSSLLLTTLPRELHHQIISHLGPANQRLLGATCVHFCQIYRASYRKTDILVNLEQDLEIRGTRRYEEIVMNWLPDLRRSPWLREMWFKALRDERRKEADGGWSEMWMGRGCLEY
ncbi:uncharacterized protein PAC_09460 [Phialocephala subalpina]|uniref:F-box domain-containing protein n=1 Tax=Phialocephala subalpina TaxID=576137 RepID=A0A1L7X3H8_9HELO|nr:uncharacterized protein PAC_09460 [Phialocephala subalpina]